MIGKEKCKALKEIRRKIALENDIEYAVADCTFQGDCKGTCPKCESELAYLEKQLEFRQKIGKTVAVVGISVGLSATLGACASPFDFSIGSSELDGDIEYAPEPLTGDMPAPEEEYMGREEKQWEDDSEEQNGEEDSEEQNGEEDSEEQNSEDDSEEQNSEDASEEQNCDDVSKEQNGEDDSEEQNCDDISEETMPQDGTGEEDVFANPEDPLLMVMIAPAEDWQE